MEKEWEASASLEASLQTYGFLILTPRGSSMWPLIRTGKDSVRLAPVDRPLREMEVPLYRRKNGMGVLHRVMKVLPDGYLMCGDHQWELEKITSDQVVGVMTVLYRKEKEVPLTSFRYRAYVRLYCKAPLFLRKFWLRCAHLCQKIGRLPKRLFCRPKG